MALIILEGLDRTGKSSMAKAFEKQGYTVIHLSAPSKEYTQPGYTGPSYLDDMIDLIQRGAIEDIVLDRSHYGELVWPKVYGRQPLLSEDDIEVLMEIEESVGVRRIMMHDPDTEAHWERCVANKEPMDRPQFLRARNLFDRLAKRYKFEKLVYTDLPEFTEKSEEIQPDPRPENTSVSDPEPTRKTVEPELVDGKTREQLKLEKANAINDVLSKRIIKGKSKMHDEIEGEIRSFLNKKLGTILGSPSADTFSDEEILILKTFIQRLKEKESR